MRFSARSLYRSRQFFRSLRASINDDEGDEVARLLSPQESALFFAMTARDQRHSLDVLHRLHGQDQTDPELLSAALLHDVGKGRIRLWHRVAYVLIRAASPRLLRRPASGPSSWRGALMAIANHAERGASLVRAAGSSDEVVRLVRYHESPDDGDARLALLRAADEKC